MSTATTVIVEADYSQFYVRGIESLGAGNTNSYLAFNFADLGSLLMTTARQYGSLPVEVTVYDERPDELGAEWQDAVEVSVLPTADTAVTGWEPDGKDFRPVLVAGQPYRVRYAIADADSAVLHDSAITERYRVDFWPEQAAPSKALRHESRVAQYWLLARTLENFRDEIYHRRDGSEQSRVEEFADRAFATFPQLAEDVLGAESTYMPTLASYATMLADLTANSDHAATTARVEAILTDRARA